MANKPWKHASASQIGTFRDCPRKWWWNKIVGVPTPSTPATELGSEVHAVLETRLKTGAWPERPSDVRASRWEQVLTIAKKEQPWLPDATIDSANIERSIEITTDVVPIIGFIDWLEPEQRRVSDHKTIGNMRYAKSEDDLAEDLQGALYVVAAHRQYGVPWPISFRHLQLPTKQGEGQTAQYEFEQEDAEALLDDAIADMHQMQRFALETEPEAVPAQKSSCRKYGGCPFVDRCGAHLGGGKMGSLWEKLSAKKGSASTTPASKPVGSMPANVFTSFTPVTPPEVKTPEVTVSGFPDPREGMTLKEIWKQEGVSVPGVTDPQPAASSPAASDGMTVYINCRPRNAQVTYLESWVTQWIDEIAESHRVTDIRLLSFGKGKIRLAEKLMEHVRDGGTLPDHLVVDRKWSYSDALLESLIPLATQVVERFM
jgi:RecB family exonuclease